MPDLTPVEVMTKAIVAEVDDRLSFNVAAYGKPWTGEVEDTEFVVGEAAQKALDALRAAGFDVRREDGASA